MKRVRLQRGQGLVEFAVIFPIFAVMLFAVVDGGLLFGRYNNLNNSAKEGARLGAVGATLAQINTRTAQQAHGELNGYTQCSGTTKDICVEWIPGPNGEPAGSIGSSVRVKVTYKYPLLTPFANCGTGVLSFCKWSGTFTVTTCAVQRLEQSISPAPRTGTGTSC